MCGLSSCTTTRLLLSLLLLVVSSGPSCWTVPWQERACTASAGLLVAAAAHSTPKEPSDSEPGAIDADISLHQQHGGGHGASTQGLLAASSLLDMLQQLRSSNQAGAGSTSTTQLLTEGGGDVGTTADDGPYSTGTVMLTELTEPASLDVLAYLMGPDSVVGSAAVAAAATATATDSDSAVLDYGNVKAEDVAGSASSSRRRLTEDGSSLFSAGGGGGAKSSAATSSTQPRVQAMDGPAPSTAPPEAASPSSTGPGATPQQQQQQQQPLDDNQQAGGLAQDCSLIDGGVPALELADKADIVVTGIALAAGPGTGMCFPNGTLGVALANVSSSESVTTSFVVLGLQCVHKGLVRCRSNPEDTGDCLILVEIPIRTDVPPCSLSQGARYIFHLQRAPDSCDGFHLAMYQMAYHTIRPPLGGTGCSFFPCYPPADDLTAKVAEQCKEPVPCDVDMCSPQITRSPCANDTAVSCNLKVCPGKFMYFNAIMPQETCYELYTYKTSGLPVNCYGQRYINNRIAQLAAQKAQLDAMQGGAAGGTGGTGSSSPGDDPSADKGA